MVVIVVLDFVNVVLLVVLITVAACDKALAFILNFYLNIMYLSEYKLQLQQKTNCIFICFPLQFNQNIVTLLEAMHGVFPFLFKKVNLYKHLYSLENCDLE